MRDVLHMQGVPNEKIWIEGRSTSTFENAAYSADILHQHGIKRILLVTEAYHMPRARMCFERQGFSVIPAACGFRSSFHLHVSELVPTWEAISWNEETLHEVVGLGYDLRYTQNLKQYSVTEVITISVHPNNDSK